MVFFLKSFKYFLSLITSVALLNGRYSRFLSLINLYNKKLSNFMLLFNLMIFFYILGLAKTGFMISS